MTCNKTDDITEVWKYSVNVSLERRSFLQGSMLKNNHQVYECGDESLESRTREVWSTKSHNLVQFLLFNGTFSSRASQTPPTLRQWLPLCHFVSTRRGDLKHAREGILAIESHCHRKVALHGTGMTIYQSTCPRLSGISLPDRRALETPQTRTCCKYRRLQDAHR